jgi:ribosomal protein S18 acetylase RimI-like enzyme
MRTLPKEQEMENPIIHKRNFQMEDYDEVVALWKRAGLELSQSDDREGITRKLERDADLFLVAIEDATIVGVVMGCYDGRRGWVNHLAVDPNYKGQGLGTQLMEEMEQRLREKGCGKVNLLIEPTNAAVQAFYQRLGYQRDELIFMEKWL